MPRCEIAKQIKYIFCLFVKFVPVIILGIYENLRHGVINPLPLIISDPDISIIVFEFMLTSCSSDCIQIGITNDKFIEITENFIFRLIQRIEVEFVNDIATIGIIDYSNFYASFGLLYFSQVNACLAHMVVRAENIKLKCTCLIISAH